MCIQGIDRPFERRSESSATDPSFSYSVLKGHHLNFEWLWPVKVILKIIDRRKTVFYLSCKCVPLKCDMKKRPTLQFRSKDRTSPPNGWTIPLNVSVIYSMHEHCASNRLRAYFNLKINGSSWCIMTFVYVCTLPARCKRWMLWIFHTWNLAEKPGYI
jgi:hypothetical protein